MALLPRAFDPTTTRPHVPGGGGLPIGEYLAVVVSNTLKPTKGNTGGYAEFTFRVVEGEFTSVTQAYRLNLINQNPETVRIAEEQLSALCHATGNGGQAVQDLDVLNNIPMILVIGPQKEQEPGKPVRTEVKGVRPYTGVAPAGAAPAGAAPAAPAWNAPAPSAPAPAQGAPAPAWGNPAAGQPAPAAPAPAPAAAPAAPAQSAWGQPQQQQQQQQPAPAAPAGQPQAWQQAAAAAPASAPWGAPAQ